MKFIFPKHKMIIICLLVYSTLIAQMDTNSAVVKNGQLSIVGTQIVNENGETVVLRGMSLFWSQWEGEFYNSDCISWLKEDWNCTVVRAAMGVEEGGYLDNPFSEFQKITTVIDACIDKGIYVIVDWHDHHAQENQQAAIGFFTQIAELYGDKPNIIYEIYNEPLQISWKNDVKPYSEVVISEIRKIDSDNIILVGSPTWSQDVDIAANDPLDYDNIAYSLHFYAATHKQSLRYKAQVALNRGVALFVSEFGTVESSGDGFLDYNEMNSWFDFMENNNISWCNWSIADKNETSAALIPGANSNGGWTDSNLSESGKFIRSKIIAYNNPTGIKEYDFENDDKKINSIQTYPNPFNSSANIKIVLTKPNKIKVDLYNMLGENIFNVVDRVLSQGEHTFSVVLSSLPSGTYLLSYKSKEENEILKMQLMK